MPLSLSTLDHGSSGEIESAGAVLDLSTIPTTCVTSGIIRMKASSQAATDAPSSSTSTQAR